ncbi:MAG: (5-formylfuran-3-yl)methyl phosphate synthase [Candidatus Altiarchaeota archaeon]
MKLLISPMNSVEAAEAVAGGADIIDVKNPAEGSLGANFPWVIRELREAVPEGIEVSATVGDFPNLPGSASLAALGAAVCGVDYVKVGLYGVKSEDEADYFAKMVVKSVKDFNPNVSVVLAAYADYRRIGSIDFKALPDVASNAGADVVMIDTAIKDGKRLFDHAGLTELSGFVLSAHRMGLKAAFGGSILGEDFPALCDIGVDIIGVRGAACEGEDRNSHIKAAKVRALKSQLLECLK